MKIGLELASTVLGSIGFLLFFLPILGIPVCIAGLILGCVSFLAAMLSGSRKPIVGIAMCVLALAINLAIVSAPAGSMSSGSASKLWPSAPHPPYVPPPACKAAIIRSISRRAKFA